MPPESPLAGPGPWNAVADAYDEETAPSLEPFAAEALTRARVGSGVRVLDVAAGPGTLALLAARAGARVDALDFSGEMIRLLREKAAREGVTTVTPRVGDGMALPYEDGLFDAAFSMFGLMFFPDRGKGLREMHRVLGAGGRAVIGSWVPLARVPLFAAMFDAVRGHVPLPPADAKAPLGDLASVREEMGAAGFTNVEATEVVHELTVPSVDAMWASFTRTTAPVVLARQKIGVAEWEKIDRGARDGLRQRFGDGPQAIRMIANLGVGRR